MNKQHTENIHNFIQSKIQKATNLIDNDGFELAFEILKEVETDIRIGMQIGLLSNDFHQIINRIKIVRNETSGLRRIDKEQL